MRRTAGGFEATARGKAPSIDVSGTGSDPRRAISECMQGVAACLELGAA